VRRDVARRSAGLGAPLPGPVPSEGPVSEPMQRNAVPGRPSERVAGVALPLNTRPDVPSQHASTGSGRTPATPGPADSTPAETSPHAARRGIGPPSTAAGHGGEGGASGEGVVTPSPEDASSRPGHSDIGLHQRPERPPVRAASASPPKVPAARRDGPVEDHVGGSGPVPSSGGSRISALGGVAPGPGVTASHRSTTALPRAARQVGGDALDPGGRSSGPAEQVDESARARGGSANSAHGPVKRLPVAGSWEIATGMARAVADHSGSGDGGHAVRRAVVRPLPGPSLTRAAAPIQRSSALQSSAALLRSSAPEGSSAPEESAVRESWAGPEGLAVPVGWAAPRMSAAREGAVTFQRSAPRRSAAFQRSVALQRAVATAGSAAGLAGGLGAARVSGQPGSRSVWRPAIPETGGTRDVGTPARPIGGPLVPTAAVLPMAERRHEPPVTDTLASTWRLPELPVVGDAAGLGRRSGPSIAGTAPGAVERSALPVERSALLAGRSVLPVERSALLVGRSELPVVRAAAPVVRPGAVPPPPAPAPPPTSGPAHNAPAPVARTAEAAPVAPARKTTPAELDELARRLVGPLSRLLRAELRLDRERVGRLRDPRY
jgi:hypothetical protein